MRNLWQPGDPTGGPPHHHITKKGQIPVVPVRVMREMQFRDEKGNLYEKHEVEIEFLPLTKPRTTAGKKKGLSSSSPNRPNSIRCWPVGGWAGGKYK